MSRAAAAPHLRMIWTGAGRTLLSDDLQNSRSIADTAGPPSRDQSPYRHSNYTRPDARRRGILGVLLSVALISSAVSGTSPASAGSGPRPTWRPSRG